MTPGLRRDIKCHSVTISILCLQNPKSDIRPQIKQAARLVIADRHFYSSPGVCVNMCKLTAFTLSPARAYQETEFGTSGNVQFEKPSLRKFKCTLKSISQS